MAELEEEERAERAKEFRTNLNKEKNIRKRYSTAAPFSGVFKQSQYDEVGSDFTQSTTSMVNPFTASTAPSVQGVPLESFGTNLIYRDVDEVHSLSKVKNFFHRAIPQPLRNALLPPLTLKEWRKFLFVHLPILHWLWTYRPKQLLGDVIAGITIGVTHVPQGIGFALLASLPPVFGLYSSFVPVLIYSFLGTSRHISVGTFPVVALMTGNAISRITHDLPICNEMAPVNSSNGTMEITTEAVVGGGDPCGYSSPECTQIQISIAVTLSLLVGILMIIMSLLKLGFITLFLSDALVSGYTAAAAFTIFITQIKFLFGLNPAEAAVQSGFFNAIRRIIKYFELIFTGHVNWAAVVTSALCIIILIGIDYLNRFLHKKVRKVPIHVPAQLIVVILATGISYAAQLGSRFDLPIISNLGGIPPRECFGVTLPDFSLAGNLIQDAIVIAIISFVINISQAKLLAKKNGYSVHPNQEFLAYGAMNLGGSFFGSFPTAGALSRTILQDTTGGQTQLVGFISSGIVILVILFLGILFGPLPNAALAAIVVVALKGLYFQVRDIYKYAKLSIPDMVVWIVVFFSTLGIGLDVGLGVGVAFSILVVVVRTVLPFSPELGETRAWHYPPSQLGEDFDEAELKVFRVPNIFIYQFNSPLYFANVAIFRSKLGIETGTNLEDLSPTMAEGCFQSACRRMCQSCTSSRKKDKNTKKVKSGPRGRIVSSEEKLISEASQGAYTAFDSAPVLSEESSDGVFSDLKEEGEEEREQVVGVAYHTIIIDCAPIGFADSMGVAMIEQVVREYDSIGVQVLLAAPTTPLCHALCRHLFFKRYSSERLFPTIATAVAYAKDGNRVPQLEQPTRPDKSLASNLERQLLYTARPSLLDDKPIELEHRTRAVTVNDIIEETETTV